MDAVDKLPMSRAREQRAIDLRVEARLAFAALGNIEQWFGLCRDAEMRSGKIGDEPRRLASIAMRAAALNFYGTPYEAVTAGEQAVALADQLNDMTWLGFAEYGLGQAYFLAGRYRDAGRQLSQAVARLAAAPENVPPGTTGPSLLVLCYTMKAIVSGWLGEFDDSEKCSKQAGDLAEKSGLPYDMVAADYGHGLVQMFRGNLEEAESALAEAALLSRENEVKLFLPLVMCALGNLYAQRGHAAKARDVLLEAKAEAEELGHATSTLIASTYLGSVYGQLGDTPRGLSVVRASQAGAKQKGYGGIEALAVFAEAAILSSQGKPAEAEAIGCMKRAIDITEKLEARPLLGAARGMLGRLLAASGRTAEAQDELVQAIALFDRSKMTVQLERAKATLSKFSGS